MSVMARKTLKIAPRAGMMRPAKEAMTTKRAARRAVSANVSSLSYRVKTFPPLSAVKNSEVNWIYPQTAAMR